MKEVIDFLKGAVELTNQIGKLTGKADIPRKPKGYVIKTGSSSPVKKLLSNTKKAELTLTLNVEPIFGEPIHLSLSARLKRGGSDDPGGKNRKTGG